MFVRTLSKTRYLALVPIAGLFLGAAVLFLAGGFGLLRYLFELVVERGLLTEAESTLSFHLMEYVEQFLTGTVLFIMAIGLYGLFIHKLDVPDWLRIETLDELKSTLIAAIVAVLAIKFLGAALEWDHVKSPLEFGVSIGVVIAALGVFLGLKAWADRMHANAHHRRAKADAEELVEKAF
jgi:uncharacterized membrane protein YqhA